MTSDLSKLWWSPTVGLIRGSSNGGHDDAKRLVVDDPSHEVECPSCGATIRARMSDTTPADLAQTRARALADGRLAAFADATDLTPVLASRTGMVDPAGELC